MDSNRLYCRNPTPVTSSTVTSNGANNTVPNEYASCDSKVPAAGLSCRETNSHSTHTTGKASHNNMRANGCGVSYSNSQVVSTAGSVASTINAGGHCNNSNGNYINVMSVPMGTLQYHRRKLTPQEYQ